MSETVHYTGKLKVIPRPEDLTDREFAINVLNKFNISFDEQMYETSEDLADFFDGVLSYKSYFIKNGLFYKVEDLESMDDEDVFEVINLGDGQYSFRLCYYNGGCGFNEALEYGFKELYK